MSSDNFCRYIKKAYGTLDTYTIKIERRNFKTVYPVRILDKNNNLKKTIEIPEVQARLDNDYKVLEKGIFVRSKHRRNRKK